MTSNPDLIKEGVTWFGGGELSDGGPEIDLRKCDFVIHSININCLVRSWIMTQILFSDNISFWPPFILSAQARSYHSKMGGQDYKCSVVKRGRQTKKWPSQNGDKKWTKIDRDVNPRAFCSKYLLVYMA